MIAIVWFFDNMMFTIQAEFKKLDPKSLYDAEKDMPFVHYLDNVDPFNIKTTFFFTIKLYLITMLIYTVAKVLRWRYLYALEFFSELLLLTQIGIAVNVVFMLMFVSYAYFIIDNGGWLEYPLSARFFIVVYYLCYSGQTLATIMLEASVFYFWLPKLMKITPIKQYANKWIYCGCGECYTPQKALTKDLLRTHEMFLIRQKEDSKEDVRITTIDPKDVYNTECSTCFEDFSGEFEENESIVLTCRHKFHVACLHEWLLKEWDGAELVNMPGLFKKIRNETDLDPMHGMIYTSFCTDCRVVYAFILCKVQENKKK